MKKRGLLHTVTHLAARCLCLLAAAFTFAPLAWAQSWPVKPIRLVVNFPAGSQPDAIARLYASRLGEALGQPVVIQNSGGAGGNIGLEIVARSAPDGYTLLHSSGATVVINEHLYKLSINVARDLEPVAPTSRTSLFLVVRPNFPAHSVAELIAVARANPGKLNFGTSGSGSTPHIAAEMMLHAARIQATHVPYKGSAQTLVALLGGEIDFTLDPGPAISQVKTGKLRVLALANATRSPLFPDTPTMAEAGVEVNMGAVGGVFAPAGMPREIVTRVNREMSRILQTAEARAAFAIIGADVVTASPEEFAAVVRRDRERFGAFVREANIRAE